MTRLITKVRSIRADRGATMLEYGLMLTLIAIIVAAAVGPLGTAVSTLFVDVPDAFGP